MLRFRATLLAIVGLALGALILFECWDALQTGIVSVPLGRRHWAVLLTITRNEQPAYFFLGLSVIFLAGAVVLLGGAMQARSLVVGSRSSREAAARAITVPLEQSAPSGLAPLWWGLLIAAACFLLYAAAA